MELHSLHRNRRHSHKSFRELAGQSSGWMLTVRFPETRMAAMLVGILEVLWSLLPMMDPSNPTIFVNILSELNMPQLWETCMFFIGALLVVTSICPWRSGRHIALFLSSTAFFSTFGFFMHNWAATPATLAFPVLGAYCLALLVVDVAKKPREWR